MSQFAGMMKNKKKHIPTGQYCYTPQYYDRNTGVYHIKLCPYYWHNPLGYGDCSFLVPKWKFWRWNGWKDYDPALDDQCKACGVNMDYEDKMVEVR